MSSASVLCTVVATQRGKEIGRLSRRIGYGENIGDESGNLLVNGSFEDGPEPKGEGFMNLPKGSTVVKGWEVTRGDVDYIGSYWQPAHGKRSLELNGNRPGGIAQTFRTQKGQTYLVTFRAYPDNPRVTITVACRYT